MIDMTTKWIPESPKFPGLYALHTPQRTGKLGETVNYGTNDALTAVQHETREACQRWCDAWNAAHPEVNGGRAWVPVEHGFVGRPKEES